MNDWIDMIDEIPELEPVDSRNDWFRSIEIAVMDTQGIESVAVYYMKRDVDVEEWWDCDDDSITRSLIRYWRPLQNVA